MTTRYGRAAAAASLAFMLGACLDMGTPQAPIYMFNSESVAVPIRVTDNEQCQLGLTTDLGQNTRTTYDVDATQGGFVCIGDGATKGFAVKANGAYMIKGDVLVDDPNPDAGRGGGGGILDALEAAGREAQGK